jgi:hypothetical protein
VLAGAGLVALVALALAGWWTSGSLVALGVLLRTSSSGVAR